MTLSPEGTRQSSQGLRAVIESPAVTHFITAVILVNAVTLGLETSPALMSAYGGILTLIDRMALGIFVLELLVKLLVYRLGYFRSGWNIFDALVIGISVLPGAGTLSVLRSLRILRALRLFSVVPSFRRVIQALMEAIPGMVSIMGVLGLLFYVASVLATKLFGEDFPSLFGSIPAAMFSLFQVMTLEGWSGEIARPVMERFPFAWLFFIPFIVITSFAVLNLFIAIIVNTMQAQVEREKEKGTQVLRQIAQEEISQLGLHIDALRNEVAALSGRLSARPDHDLTATRGTE